MFKKSLMVVLATIVFSGTTICINQATTTNAKKLTPNLIRKYYPKEYKIKVKKTRRAAIVKYRKRGGFYIAGHVTIHKGETVRTYFRGAGPFEWQVTGGKHGKYTTKNKKYSVNWTNTNQFKILHAYSIPKTPV